MVCVDSDRPAARQPASVALSAARLGTRSPTDRPVLEPQHSTPSAKLAECVALGGVVPLRPRTRLAPKRETQSSFKL